MKQTIKLIVLALVATFWCAAAVAEVVGKINRGVDNPTSIAIAPVSVRGTTVSEDIRTIVASDLTSSGLFRTIGQERMLSFPATAREVHYRDWRFSGAEYLVVTQLVAKEADKIAVTFSLMNITAQKAEFTTTLDGSRSTVRKMAHIISDKVYEAITGVRGAFSTQLLYVTSERSSRGIQYRLMRADADGAREVELLNSSEPIMSPAWSPDGKEVLYVSFESGRSAIYRQNIATGKSEQLTNFKGINSAPAWSPDGNQLALTLSKDGNPELYLFDLRTRRFKRLTRQAFAIDTEPTWMPDSKHLLFTSDRGGSPQIYKMNVASGKVQRLTFRGSYNARGRLAPDGRTLVMVHRDNGKFHIAAYDLVSKVFQVLTETNLGRITDSVAQRRHGVIRHQAWPERRAGSGFAGQGSQVFSSQRNREIYVSRRGHRTYIKIKLP